MDFFKKTKKLSHGHLRELDLLCGAAALLMLVVTSISISVPDRVLAGFVIVAQFTASANPVPVSTAFNIFYSGTGIDSCFLYGTYDNGAHTFWSRTSNGNSNTLAVPSGITQTALFGIQCVNGGSSSSQTGPWVYLTVNVGAADNCPSTPTSVSGGLQVPPGTYHIVAQGYDFCVTNYSGQYLFVPASSATEVSYFLSATQGYLAGTVAYFARATGY